MNTIYNIMFIHSHSYSYSYSYQYLYHIISYHFIFIFISYRIHIHIHIIFLLYSYYIISYDIISYYIIWYNTWMGARHVNVYTYVYLYTVCKQITRTYVYTISYNDMSGCIDRLDPNHSKCNISFLCPLLILCERTKKPCSITTSKTLTFAHMKSWQLLGTTAACINDPRRENFYALKNQDCDAI